MNKRRSIRKWIGLGLLVSAMAAYAVSLLVGSARSDVSAAAREVGRRVEYRTNGRSWETCRKTWWSIATGEIPS